MSEKKKFNRRGFGFEIAVGIIIGIIGIIIVTILTLLEALL